MLMLYSPSVKSSTIDEEWWSINDKKSIIFKIQRHHFYQKYLYDGDTSFDSLINVGLLHQKVNN